MMEDEINKEGIFDHDKLVEMVAAMMAAHQTADAIVYAICDALIPEDDETCPICGVAP